MAEANEIQDKILPKAGTPFPDYRYPAIPWTETPSSLTWNEVHARPMPQTPEEIQVDNMLVSQTVAKLVKGEDADLLDLKWNHTGLLQRIFTQSLLESVDDAQATVLADKFDLYLGIAAVRSLVRENADNPRIMETLKNKFAALGLDPEEDLALDLARDVYGKVDMTSYGPYAETLPMEVDLLTQAYLEDGVERVLDVGCGQGRHLLALDKALAEKGKKIHLAGLDMLEDDVQRLKDQAPNLDVRVGSWHDIPFDDLSFDVISMLGRSFTHNVTTGQAINCLLEMGRKLKDGGQIILDLPNPYVGEYKELVEKTKKVFREKGIGSSLYVPGLIVDSPDGKHFYDRLALSENQFWAVAQMAGLAAKVVGSREYHGQNGEIDENLYYRLTKIIPPVKLNRMTLADLSTAIYQKPI